MLHRFGEFLYDPLNRALSRGEDEIALTPKARDLLALFLENPKRLLTRRVISDRLWPDVAGERIECALSLSDGDSIRIGRVSMIFRVLSRVISTETEENRRGRS